MSKIKSNYVGYARVSSKGQNLSRQIKKLTDDGVAPQNIYQEKISGAHANNRPQLQKMLRDINKTNVVEVVALDRIGRNADDIHRIIDKIKDKGATLEVLNLPSLRGVNNKDIRKLLDDLIVDIFSWQAQQERKEIKARQAQGIAIAKRNGVYKGRNEKFTKNNPKVQRAFKRYYKSRIGIDKMTVGEIAGAAGMSRKTFYRKFNAYKPQPQNYLDSTELKIFNDLK